jgi:Cu/Ag efflux pump CusA
MKRSGLMTRIDKMIWPDETDGSVQGTERNVTLSTMSIIFVILCAGIVVSVFVLMVENCWLRLYRFKHRSKKDPSLKQKRTKTIFCQK